MENLRLFKKGLPVFFIQICKKKKANTFCLLCLKNLKLQATQLKYVGLSPPPPARNITSVVPLTRFTDKI